METPDERDRTLPEDKADAVLSKANSEVFPFCLKPFEIGNFMERSGGFHLFNGFLDLSQQSGSSDC